MKVIDFTKREGFLTKNSDVPFFLPSELSNFNHINKSRKIKIRLKNGEVYIVEYTDSSWEYLYKDLDDLKEILKKANLKTIKNRL